MFALRWRKSVSRELLDRCAQADKTLRDSILQAMDEVEAKLRDQPEFVGESREANRRLLIVAPLSVTYRVDHRKRIVYILAARVHHTTN
jgi:hypothetical protein